MKKKNLFLVLIVVGLMVFAVPYMACANWGFSMGDDGWYTKKVGNRTTDVHTNMTKVELFIPSVAANTGYTWAGQGVTNLSSSSWSASKINPTYVLAQGPSVSSLYWDVLFSGSAPSTFYMDYLVYGNNKNKPVYAIRLTIKNGVPDFSSSGWSYLDVNHLPSYNRNPVPLPPSVWLLGAGLVGAFVMRRKMMPRS